MAVNPKVLTTSGAGLGALGYSDDLGIAIGSLFGALSPEQASAWGRLVQGLFVLLAMLGAGWWTPDERAAPKEEPPPNGPGFQATKKERLEAAEKILLGLKEEDQAAAGVTT